MMRSSEQDEGLHSSKAIVFISNKYNQKNVRLNTKTYFIVRNFPQQTKFLKTRNQTANMLNVNLAKNLGDKKWTK